jgi:methanol corrinoid protein
MSAVELEPKVDFDFLYKRYNVIVEGPAVKPEEVPEAKVSIPVDEPFKSLARAVLYGELDKSVAETKEALKRIAPLDVINKGLVKGMDAVGALYTKGVYFLPDVMIAADALMGSISICEEKLGHATQKKGTVVSFVAEGDPHDIGKNLIVMLLKAGGWETVDLGRDVTTETVLESVKTKKPVMLTGTALMTTTMTQFPAIAEELTKKGIPVPVFGCGGGALTRSFVEGFDLGVYGVKAHHAPKLADAIIEKKYDWKELRKRYEEIVGEYVAQYR